MQIILKDNEKYRRVMIALSVLTSVGAIGCILLGYLFLPLAAAFYSALLIYENPKRRIVSYVIPITLTVVSVLINGNFYVIESLAYIMFAIVIFLCVRKNTSKAECVFWLMLTCCAFFIMSTLFFAVEAGKSISEFYTEVFYLLEEKFVMFITSLSYVDNDGTNLFYYNAYEAKNLFREFMLLAIPMLIILAFFITGITLKILSAIIRRTSDENSEFYKWSFRLPSTVAYFYIFVALINVFSAGEEGVFAFVITSLNLIFMFVFAYHGAELIYTFIKTKGKSAFFSVTVIILSIIIFYSFSIQLLSYIGAYFNITVNNSKKRNSTSSK